MEILRKAVLVGLIGTVPVSTQAIANANNHDVVINDHRIDYSTAARLAYRLASLAENLANGYGGRVSPYPGPYRGAVALLAEEKESLPESVEPEDHSYDLRRAAERLHVAASDLYYSLRGRGGYNNSYGILDHREDQARYAFREVSAAYHDLRQVASYWQISQISAVYNQLSYAITGYRSY